VVPVMPSEIDIHAASRCIADLLLVGKVHRSERRLVIVANRARRYTKAFQSLMKFLQSLRIPVAAVLRDSQAYVRSAETGMGLHEMKGALLQEDIDTFRPLLDWLEKRTESLVATDESAAVNGAPPADARESSSVMAVSDEAAAPSPRAARSASSASRRSAARRDRPVRHGVGAGRVQGRIVGDREGHVAGTAIRIVCAADLDDVGDDPGSTACR
jgi:chromosome partitioning protein